MNVLILDDQKVSADVLTEGLENIGLTVLAMSNINKALDYIDNNKVDIMLIDIFLGNNKGYDVCKTLKDDSHTKKIPIILISLEDQAFGDLLANTYGADSYFMKLDDIDILANRIKELI